MLCYFIVQSYHYTEDSDSTEPYHHDYYYIVRRKTGRRSSWRVPGRSSWRVPAPGEYLERTERYYDCTEENRKKKLLEMYQEFALELHTGPRGRKGGVTRLANS